MGKRAALRMDPRDVGSAESDVVGEMRRMRRRRVVPDAGTAESPAICHGKRIHIMGRDKREREPSSCL